MTYRTSSNKRLGTYMYFLQGLQDPAFIRGPAVISYCLFLIAYFLPLISKIPWTYDVPQLWCTYVVCKHFLQKTSTFRAVMAFVCTPRKLLAKRQSFSAIRRSKRNSLDKRQREFAWQIDCLTNDRLLDTKFSVKLCVHAVCEARWPTWDHGVYLNPGVTGKCILPPDMIS